MNFLLSYFIKLGLTTKDIANFKQSIIGPSSTKEQADLVWAEIQKIIDTEPESVRIRKNGKGELECLYIQTSYMRKWFTDFNTVLHIDSTFKVNLENFQLYISLVANEHYHGVPTSYCFMKSACGENLQFFYENITGTKLNHGKIEIIDEELANCKPDIIMIDKDLTNIDLLTNFFPNSIQYLCYFHVKKYFKKKVNDQDLNKDDKKQLHDQLVKLLEVSLFNFIHNFLLLINFRLKIFRVLIKLISQEITKS